LQEAIKIASAAGYSELILEQIAKDKIGNDLDVEASNNANGEVRLMNLIEFLYI
jgi:hypothetical protein